MDITGTIVQTVKIDPLKVLQNLKRSALGGAEYAGKEEDKYFVYIDISRHGSSCYSKKEITKGDYEYIQALEVVIKKLQEEG